MANTKVTTGVIKDDAVGADQLASNSVVTASIVDNAVTTAKINNDAILTAKISNSAVTNAKLAANSVDSDQYVDGSIDTAHIADGQITSAKLDTNISVSGELTVGSHLNMGDNDILKIGASDDLQIYHDGSNSYIKDTGTGRLTLQSATDFLIANTANTQNYIYAQESGYVRLYYAGATKLATTSSGVDVTGTVTADGLTIDGNVEIGSIETATNFPLIVKSGTNNHAIAIEEASGGETWQLGVDVDGDLGFYNSGSTTASVTFDDSGNLLVSHTGGVYNNVNTTSTVGSSYTVNGEIFACSDQSSGVMILNRKSSDGNIASFRKDGTTVGSIGSTSGVVSHIVLDPRTGVKGAGLLGSSADANTGILQPVNHSGALADGAIQLGTSSNRFKDLHLSGTANVGSVSSGSASSASEIIATSLDNGTSFGSNRMLKLVGTSTTDNSRMGIHFTGNTGIGNGLAIIEAVNEDQSAGHTSLRMHTYSGSWNENNLVLKSGSVGIGTSSPDDMLDVENGNIRLRSNSDGNTGLFRMFDAAGTEAGQIYAASGDLKIYSPNDVLFTQSGNVGIGTGIPDYLLEAYNGDISSLKLTSAAGGNAVNALRFRVRNSGNTSQYATLGTVSAETVSSWGGVLTFSTKPASGSPDESTTERMRIASNGMILIGTTSTSGLAVQNTDQGVQLTPEGRIFNCCDDHSDFNRQTAGETFRFRTATTKVGSISVTASATAYNTSSDYRLKENVDYEFNALDRVAQLKPARFNFIADETNTLVDGFLAHEVQDIVPEAISGEKDAVDDEGNPDYQGIDQSKLVPLLTKAIQELSSQVEELKAEIQELKE